MLVNEIALYEKIDEQIKYQQDNPLKGVKDKNFQDGFVTGLALVKKMVEELITTDSGKEGA